MKRNQFFDILKVQSFKDTIPKFESCLKNIGDFITPENCAILFSKMVFESRGQNVPDDVVLWTRLRDCNTIRRVLVKHHTNILVVI